MWALALENLSAERQPVKFNSLLRYILRIIYTSVNKFSFGSFNSLIIVNTGGDNDFTITRKFI